MLYATSTTPKIKTRINFSKEDLAFLERLQRLSGSENLKQTFDFYIQINSYQGLSITKEKDLDYLEEVQKVIGSENFKDTVNFIIEQSSMKLKKL